MRSPWDGLHMSMLCQRASWQLSCCWGMIMITITSSSPEMTASQLLRLVLILGGVVSVRAGTLALVLPSCSFSHRGVSVCAASPCEPFINDAALHQSPHGKSRIEYKSGFHAGCI